MTRFLLVFLVGVPLGVLALAVVVFVCWATAKGDVR